MNDVARAQLFELLERLVKAQERIADADEYRNKLLEVDQTERRAYLVQQRQDEQARWASLADVERDIRQGGEGE